MIRKFYVLMENTYPHDSSDLVGWTDNPIIMGKFNQGYDTKRNVDIAVYRCNGATELSILLQEKYQVKISDFIDSKLNIAYSRDNRIYAIYTEKYKCVFEQGKLENYDIYKLLGSIALRYAPYDKYVCMDILPSVMRWHTHTAQHCAIDTVYLLRYISTIKYSYKIPLPNNDGYTVSNEMYMLMVLNHISFGVN